MDKVFDAFESWIKSKVEDWKQQDVTIYKIEDATHAHQMHVKVDSVNGVGHIGLYESNKIYWMEFEACARDFENYYKYIEFDELPELNSVEQEYLYFLTKEK